ncbi:MAG: TetR/AcrR family transcriptional regulator [Gemmobacter sp.]
MTALPQPQPVVARPRTYADHLRDTLASGTFATKGERTRHRLRIAAAQALEEGGYQGLKVADVCTLADVALGTFYVYFKDKTEIASDVVMRFIDHLYDGAREVARGAGDYDSIFRTNLFFVQAYRANPGLMRCHVQLQSDEPGFRAIWQPRHRQWLDTLARSIQKRSRDPAMTAPRALKVAAALEGMVFNYLYAANVTHALQIEPDGSDPAEMAETLSVLWYRGVHGRDPDRG